MEGRVILLGDINAHSPQSNHHSGERRDAAGLETPVERHDLIYNNEPGKTTRPTCRNTTSIINLTFNTQEIGELDS